MRKAILAVFALIALTVGASLWFVRPGTFSYINYLRIQPGMALAEVEEILGCPGTEISEAELPGIVDWTVPLDHPERVKAVLSGERYFRWYQQGDEIIISLRGGVLAEKWYSATSL